MTLVVSALTMSASVALAAPVVTKILARSTTTTSSADVSVGIYTRYHPDYEGDLRLYRGWLAEAQEDLRERRRSIVTIGKPTPAQQRSIDEHLRPYRDRVAEAKARIARLQARFVKPFRAYGFRVAGSGPVELSWQISCERGSRKQETSGEVTRSAPFELWRPPSIARAGHCFVAATAYRSGSSRLVLSALGRR